MGDVIDLPTPGRHESCLCGSAWWDAVVCIESGRVTGHSVPMRCHECGRERTPSLAAAPEHPVPGDRLENDRDLAAVPRGTIVRASDGTIAARYIQDLGVVFGDERPFPWTVLTAPAVVLWAEDPSI